MLFYYMRRSIARSDFVRSFLIGCATGHCLFRRDTIQRFCSNTCCSLFLIVQNDNIFQYDRIILPTRRRGLVVFGPNRNNELRCTNTCNPLRLVQIRLPPRALTRLSSTSASLRGDFGIIPFQRITIHPSDRVCVLLGGLTQGLLVLPRRHARFNTAIFRRNVLRVFIILTLHTYVRTRFRATSIDHRRLVLSRIFLFVRTRLARRLALRQLRGRFFISRRRVTQRFGHRAKRAIRHCVMGTQLSHYYALVRRKLPVARICGADNFNNCGRFFHTFGGRCNVAPGRCFRAAQRSTQK